MNTQQHYGRTLIAGPVNSGKSTLLNKLIQFPLSSVSRKKNLTTSYIAGVMTRDNRQSVIIDTPGIITSNSQIKYQKGKIKSPTSYINDVHTVVITIDCSSTKMYDLDAIKTLIKAAREANSNVFLALNKVDLIDDKKQLLAIASQYNHIYNFDKIFMISAMKSNGINDLLEAILSSMPQNSFKHKPEDVTVDLSLEDIAVDLIRESIFHYVHQEIPYALRVSIEKWQEDEKFITIYANIHISKSSTRPIILGHKGQNIKLIGMRARGKIADIAEKKTSLFLHIKNVPNSV